MSLVVRALVIYVFLLLIMRASGKRQFAQLSSFDVVLLLIIAEAVQQALLGDEDFSLTAAVILVVTLVGIDIVLSVVKRYWRTLDTVLEGTPVLLLDNGKLIERNLKQERIDEADILTAARETQGLERLDQIRYAVLESHGKISIIPADAPKAT
jgi:uncharacterized membrane protein YcaP (DUF421 family)